MPDVRESLIAFYKLLKETFPLEGMVMHHFLPSSQSLLELHFIHDGGIHFLGRFIPFSREQTMFLRAFSLTGGVNAIPNSQEVRTAESVNNDLREFIENRPRAHLVCCLKGVRRSGCCGSLGRRWGVSRRSMSGGWACWRFP